MSVALAFLIAAIAAPPDDEPENKPAPDARPAVRVIDPTYVPQIGDKASLDTGGKDEEGDPYAIVAAVSADELANYLRLQLVPNQVNTEQLEKEKKIVLLDAGTDVLITGMNPIVFDRVQLPRGIAGRAAICVEIKVLSGEEKGKVLYTVGRDIVRYTTVALPTDQPTARSKGAKGKTKGRKPKTTTAPTAKPAAAEPANDATRAASMLKLGQNLEKAGKTEGALAFYRKVVKQFPQSAQARTAEERIKALGKGS